MPGKRGKELDIHVVAWTWPGAAPAAAPNPAPAVDAGPIDALREAVRSFTWGTAMRFEAADEATCMRVLMQVRTAAERGLHLVCE